MAKERILITGSAGLSGDAIAELLAAQYEIVGLDIRKSRFTTRVGTLADWNTVKDIMKGVSAIIHTAALHAPHIPTHTRADFVETNIKGTLHLLEAAAQHDVRTLVYTSTTSLYGAQLEDPDKAVWVTEDVQPMPRDIYDITKLTAEALCKDFFDKTRLKTVSLRVSRFWNEPLERRFFYRMYRGLDVRDVARAHQLALEATLDRFEVFNISAQSIFEHSDIFDLRHHLHRVLAQRCPDIVELFHRREWDLPTSIDRIYVIDKAKEQLGYRPRYNIDSMLEELG